MSGGRTVPISRMRHLEDHTRTTCLLTNSGIVFYRLSAFHLEISTKKVITDLLPQVRQDKSIRR